MVSRPARPTTITIITERIHHGDSGDSSGSLPGCVASLMVLSPDKDGQCLHNVRASRLKIKEPATDERENRREQFKAEKWRNSTSRQPSGSDHRAHCQTKHLSWAP